MAYLNSTKPIRSCPRRGLIMCAIVSATALATVRPASAQMDDSLFSDLGFGVFGLLCVHLPAYELDPAARLFGLVRVTDPAVADRYLQGNAGRVWVLLNAARTLTLLRADQSGACVMEMRGVPVANMEMSLVRLANALRSDSMDVRSVEVPRGLPRPALRARYTLHPQGGDPGVLELRADTGPSQAPGGVAVLRGGTP